VSQKYPLPKSPVPVPHGDKIPSTFYPYAIERENAVAQNGGLFVHYTSAEVGVRILQSETMWMRNARGMNDYSEVNHGHACLLAAYKAEGKLLAEAIDSAHPGLSDEAVGIFNAWFQQGILKATFITSVSEFCPATDAAGRLLMWTAYAGRGPGVAFVFNGQAMQADVANTGLASSPVLYANHTEYQARFAKLAAGISAAREWIREVPRDTIKNHLVNILRLAVLCTKHPSFADEREWRVVATPDMYTPHPKVLSSGIEVVRGIPQVVQKINLNGQASELVPGLSIHEMLHHVIVGPCSHPLLVEQAYIALLREKGIAEPEKRVEYCNSPLAT
jgi:hypothetical protein